MKRMKKEVLIFHLIYFFKKAGIQRILFQIKNLKLQIIVISILFMLREHLINNLLEIFKKFVALQKI